MDTSLSERRDFAALGAGEESAGSGAEGRARKRFQRSITENDDPLRKPSLSLPFSRSTRDAPSQHDAKMTSHARRRSTLRDNNRPLLGPRPFESKRVTSESHAAATAPRPSYLPTSTTDSAIGINPRYSFSKLRENSQSRESNSSQDFLPSVNFDDFHASLASYDPDLINHFPAPTTLAPTPTSTRLESPSKILPLADGKPFSASTMERGFGLGRGNDEPSKIARSSSLARRTSNARRNPSQSAADAAAMPPPSAPGVGRGGRRQSSMNSTTSTAPATTNAARPPRKSIGPGLLTQGMEERRAAREAQQSLGSISRTASMNKGNRRETLGVATTSSGPDLARLAQPRNPRTKSLLPPARGQTQSHLAATPVNGVSAASNPVSPARTTNQRSHTPSSSNGNNNKRQSVHVGGLGARTISPTDARRLKRLSTAGPKLPIPQAPPTPQPETLPGLLPSGHVQVSQIRNKSATPSSPRHTPDISKRTMIGQIPTLTSSSSYSSLRAPNGGASSRNSQIYPNSRIPTPKPRNVHSSAGFQEEEEVPPVPAIPKAYESPKEAPLADSYFGARKSQRFDPDDLRSSVSKLSIDSSSVHAASRSIGRPSLDSEGPSFAQATSSSRHRRGMTVGSGDHGDKTPTSNPALNKKNLQPLRLPPLNLLPLSTPTATRIANFSTSSAEPDQRHATPPPKRNYTKTPSTPMTASKATFFAKKDQDFDDDYRDIFKRSASSTHMMNNNQFGSRMFGLSPTTPVAIPSPFPRQSAHTPFASSSLPKSGGDYTHLAPEHALDTEVHAQQFDGTKVMDVSASQPVSKPNLLSKREAPSARTSTSDEPGTPASTTSGLRRKLSLSWKRSSSKASQRAKAEAEKAEKEREKEEAKRGSKPTKNEMPPPKLPASATWNGTFSPATTESSSRPSFERYGRKPSGTGSVKDVNANGADPGLFNMVPDLKASNPDLTASQTEHRRTASRSASSSVLTPMQRILGTKSSLGTLKARNLDTNLDKNDLAADKIMEKMGSKRKDFDHAARELDDLRRRAVPRERHTPQQAAASWDLNIFERGEIIDYKEVYFYGTRNAKKHVGDLNHATNNFGYDDDRGDYNIVMGDHLAYRYEVVDMLGKGSFGQVVRCIDHKTGMLVAIKIIRNKKRFHQQALVEVNILQKLREWDPENKHSMINFTQSFYFRGHLCISTELLGMNLYEFIKAYEFKGFPLTLIRRFTKQMLSSLCLLKTKRVIHCDLKPENILLAHPMHSEIKVIDFGSSCFEHEKVYTYIQSRFYRSPEVILGMSYGIPIDMWSLGCILAELLTGYPIFPGENEQEQLACIMEIFGPPEKHLIEKSSRKKLFFDSVGKPRVTVSSKGRRRRPSSKTLQQALKCDDEAFLDFIQRCLRWDPDRRLKPDEAMHHDFITGSKRTGPAKTRVAQSSNGPTATNSPVKRFNTVHQTPRAKPQQQLSTEAGGTAPRPLPEPPATAYRNGTAVPAPSASPVKGGPGRRHSTFTAGQTTAAKRTVPAPSASGLPRAAQGPGAGRSVSGRPDLASAAAAAASNGSMRLRL